MADEHWWDASSDWVIPSFTIRRISRACSLLSIILVWGWYILGTIVSAERIGLGTAVFLSCVIFVINGLASTPHLRIVQEIARRSAGHAPGIGYRFGTVFGLLSLGAGTYCAWLAEFGSLNGAEPWMLALSALIVIGSGLGLLRKRGYGFRLMSLSLIASSAYALGEWLDRPGGEMLTGAALLLAWLTGCVIVWIYFWMRREEFLFKWKYF